MRPAGELHKRGIATEQCVDICYVLRYSYLITLPFILLVPLIVVVKDERDDVLESVDESIGGSRIDEPMEATVEV